MRVWIQSIPGPFQWVKDPGLLQVGIGCGCSSNLALLWLWCRPAATAPTGPLAWEPPYAAGVALEKAKRQEEEEKKKRLEFPLWYNGIGSILGALGHRFNL